MAGSNRRFTLAAVALPLLMLTMSGMARAAGTVTNCTTFGPAAGTLQAALAGGGTVTFACSGTIIVPEIKILFDTTSIDATGQSVTLSGNNANRVFASPFVATLNLTNLTVANGSSVGDAGGILNNFGTLTLTNCTLTNNSAVGGSDGGGIRNYGTLTVTNSTFSGNVATGGAGGGIENFGTLTVTNSTFSDNGALGDLGGGIFNHGTLTVTNSTFSGNSARDGGGGIFTDASATLKGTILAAESGGGNCAGTAATASYSIADDGTCFTNGVNGNVVEPSTSAVGLDPAGLAMNGGPTETIALEPNSQAVDSIPVASCTDQSSPTPQPLTTDQRGLPRPDPGNPNFCDAGAFELQTTPFVIAPNSERLQIARSTIPNSDHINTAFTFIENGFPACDAADNAFNGFFLVLESGTCATHDHESVLFFLNPWVVHTVNHQSYGTLFNTDPPLTVSARMVELPTPAAPACGEWSLNLEIAGIDSTPLGNGPFSLILGNADGDTECFDITNAIVGSQTPPPPHGVRRRKRR